METSTPLAKNLPQEFASDALESVRNKLLDMSNRNNLLNYKHPKSSCVRVVGSSVEGIYKILREGKELIFRSVPKPTEKQLIKAGYGQLDPETEIFIASKRRPTALEWANNIGIPVSYDFSGVVSEPQNLGNKLQLLMFSDEMDASLRSLCNKAKSSIEDKGVNTLYLAIGFLKWFESNDSKEAKLAPLFTIPVTLKKSPPTRKGGTYHYSIQIKDDEFFSNISLKEKLVSNFNLVFPDIEEDLTPSEYLEKVSSLILRHQPD